MAPSSFCDACRSLTHAPAAHTPSKAVSRCLAALCAMYSMLQAAWRPVHAMMRATISDTCASSSHTINGCVSLLGGAMRNVLDAAGCMAPSPCYDACHNL
eukprot:7219578-Prymnesium_polylepis.1